MSETELIVEPWRYRRALHGDGWEYGDARLADWNVWLPVPNRPHEMTLDALAAAQAENARLLARVEAVERFAMTENGTVEFNGARWVAEFDRWGDERNQVASAVSLDELGAALLAREADDAK